MVVRTLEDSVAPGATASPRTIADLSSSAVGFGMEVPATAQKHGAGGRDGDRATRSTPCIAHLEHRSAIAATKLNTPRTAWPSSPEWGLRRVGIDIAGFESNSLIAPQSRRTQSSSRLVLFPRRRGSRGRGLTLDNGIVCDSSPVPPLMSSRLETCVAFRSLSLADSFCIEHWTNAAEQGIHVARDARRRGRSPGLLIGPVLLVGSFRP